MLKPLLGKDIGNIPNICNGCKFMYTDEKDTSRKCSSLKIRLRDLKEKRKGREFNCLYKIQDE